MFEFMEIIAAGILVFIIFLGFSSPILIIGLVYYFKKRLEHKQVMAAIEKGTSLSELKPLKPVGPLWIKSLTAGIALVIVAAAMLGIKAVYFKRWGCYFDPSPTYLIISVILFALGVSRIIRGLLQRKAQKSQETLPQQIAVEK